MAELNKELLSGLYEVNGAESESVSSQTLTS